VVELRSPSPTTSPSFLPRILALNAHEGITMPAPRVEAALDRLLRDPGLGGAWLIEQGGAAIGYAIADLRL